MIDTVNMRANILNRGITPATFNVEIPVAWETDSTNGGFYQVVAVESIKSTDTPLVDIVLGADITANKASKEDWMLVDRITTEDGTITLYANESAPTTAFTICLKVVR